MTVLYPAIVVAAWVVRISWRVVPVLGWLTAATAALSIVAGLVVPDLARYQDYEGADADKSGPLGILAGLLPSGNNLGLALAVGIPSVLALRGASRLVAGSLVLVALGWSYSRGAWLAAVVVLAAAAVLALVPQRRRALVAGVGMGAVALVAVVLPLVTTSATAMANRGGYWVAGRDAVGAGAGARPRLGLLRPAGTGRPTTSAATPTTRTTSSCSCWSPGEWSSWRSSVRCWWSVRSGPSVPCASVTCGPP